MEILKMLAEMASILLFVGFAWWFLGKLMG